MDEDERISTLEHDVGYLEAQMSELRPQVAEILRILKYKDAIAASHVPDDWHPPEPARGKAAVKPAAKPKRK